MLNYWRTTGDTGGGAAATFFAGNSTFSSRPAANNPLIPAASPFSDYGFDGPFFDLEFSLSSHIDQNDDASETSRTETGSGDSSESDEELREIELNLDVGDRDFEISPSYKGQDNSKFAGSLLKSAAKFRVLLLKLKKPDSSNGDLEKVEKSEKIDGDNELLRVKFKVDEVKGPLISLFARDYSISEQNTQDSGKNSANLGKEMMQKYLNILKHLYVGVEKMKNSGQVRCHGGGGPNCGGAVSPPSGMARAGLRGNNLQAGLKVVRKHLGNSRSTSAEAAAAAGVSPPAKMGSNRHDDSLLEVQDGIQGAILHCKRSFNSDREGELSRSVSNPYCEKSVIS